MNILYDLLNVLLVYMATMAENYLGFNKEQCKKLISKLILMHNTNDALLTFIKKNSQQASAFGGRFLFSVMTENTLYKRFNGDADIVSQLYPDFTEEKERAKGAILFKILNHKILIYQLEDLDLNAHGNYTTLTNINLLNSKSKNGKLIAIPLNGEDKEPIEINLLDEQELKEYYFMLEPGDDNKLVTKGWDTNSTIATRKTQYHFSQWTRFAGMMNRYILPQTSYGKFLNSDVKAAPNPMVSVKSAMGMGGPQTARFVCTICGDTIGHSPDVDHCWNLRFNEILSVINKPVGYFNTHSSCNRSKSDKLYFPTDEVWNKLLNCLDEDEKKFVEEWKQRVIDDNEDYPIFTLGKTQQWNDTTPESKENMDKLYLKRLHLIDSTLEPGEPHPLKNIFKDNNRQDNLRTETAALIKLPMAQLNAFVVATNLFMQNYEYILNSISSPEYDDSLVTYNAYSTILTQIPADALAHHLIREIPFTTAGTNPQTTKTINDKNIMEFYKAIDVNKQGSRFTASRQIPSTGIDYQLKIWAYKTNLNQRLRLLKEEVARVPWGTFETEKEKQLRKD